MIPSDEWVAYRAFMVTNLLTAPVPVPLKVLFTIFVYRSNLSVFKGWRWYA